MDKLHLSVQHASQTK